MKRFSLFIFSILIIISFLSVSVNAENKKYTIESVHFDVLLTEHGDANITETWVINYEKGEFNKFYKNIYIDLPKEEEFSDIEDLEVEVDGEEYELTLDGSRSEGFYSSSYSDSTYTYEVYFNKSEEISKITVSYTLKDIVKCVENEYYMFVYRFLPAGYKNNISNFSINIKTEQPEESKMTVLYKTKGDLDVGFNTNIEASNVSDMYKVKLRIDGNIFSTLSSKSYLNNEDIKNSNNSSSIIGDLVVFFIFGFGLIFFIILIIAIISGTDISSSNNKNFIDDDDDDDDCDDSDRRNSCSSCSSCSSCGGCGGSD